MAILLFKINMLFMNCCCSFSKSSLLDIASRHRKTDLSKCIENRFNDPVSLKVHTVVTSSSKLGHF